MTDPQMTTVTHMNRMTRHISRETASAIDAAHNAAVAAAHMHSMEHRTWDIQNQVSAAQHQAY